MKKIQGKSILKAKVPIKKISKGAGICKRLVSRLRSRRYQRQRGSLELGFVFKKEDRRRSEGAFD